MTRAIAPRLCAALLGLASLAPSRLSARDEGQVAVSEFSVGHGGWVRPGVPVPVFARVRVSGEKSGEVRISLDGAHWLSKQVGEGDRQVDLRGFLPLSAVDSSLTARYLVDNEVAEEVSVPHGARPLQEEDALIVGAAEHLERARHWFVNWPSVPRQVVQVPRHWMEAASACPGCLLVPDSGEWSSPRWSSSIRLLAPVWPVTAEGAPPWQERFEFARPEAFRRVQPDLVDAFTGLPWDPGRRMRLAALAAALILAASLGTAFLRRRGGGSITLGAAWGLALAVGIGGLAGAAFGVVPAGGSVRLGSATLHFVKARGDEHLTAELTWAIPDRAGKIQLDGSGDAVAVDFTRESNGLSEGDVVVHLDGDCTTDITLRSEGDRRMFGFFRPAEALRGRFLAKPLPPAGDLSLENATPVSLRAVWAWDGKDGWVRLGDWPAGTTRVLRPGEFTAGRADRTITVPAGRGGWQADRLLKTVCAWAAPTRDGSARQGTLWLMGWSDPDEGRIHCSQAYSVTQADALWVIRIDPWP